jgi:hypothetical protein
MTINLLRTDPKAMLPIVKAFKKHKFYKGQPIQPLVQYLQNMSALPIVKLDDNACKACRNNTEKKMN